MVKRVEARLCEFAAAEIARGGKVDSFMLGSNGVAACGSQSRASGCLGVYSPVSLRIWVRGFVVANQHDGYGPFSSLRI